MKKFKLLFLLAFVAMSVGVNGQTDDAETIPKEAQLLAQPGVSDFAKRFGDTLMMKLDNGEYMIFVNNKKAELSENEVIKMENPETGILDTAFLQSSFLIIDYVCNGKFYLLKTEVVHQSEFYSDVKYILINKKNGTKNTLFSVPIFSPDNNTFIEVCKMSFEQYEPEIKISSITNIEQIKVEFDLKPSTELWFIDSVKWINNTEFQINRTKEEKRISSIKYKFNGTKWVLATSQGAKPAVKKPVKK